MSVGSAELLLDYAGADWNFVPGLGLSLVRTLLPNHISVEA